jgi:hypothetical protein
MTSCQRWRRCALIPRFYGAARHADRRGDDDPDRAGPHHRPPAQAAGMDRMLEPRLGCPLTLRKPGPKPRVERDTAQQAQLL